MSYPNDPGQDSGPWRPQLVLPRGRGPRRVTPGIAGAVVVALAAAGTLLGSFYTVQPTEMAGVRRFGTVLTTEPVGPGLHMKLPWVDTVDTIQTSLDTYQLDDLVVYTIDNQPVRVGIGMSYRIPREAVLKLLYGIGRTGNLDIAANIRPVLADRVLQVFSTENTVNISANREQISTAIRKGVAQGLGSIFGLEITDLQLSSITYSPSFQASVEAAVQAKNDAIRAENLVSRVRYEGEQAKVSAEAQAAVRIAQANAEAGATVAQARAQRESAILRAEGEAQAATLTGEAQARVVQQVGVAVAANPTIISYEASHRWNGQLPGTMLGGTTSPLSMFNIQPGQPAGGATPTAAAAAPGHTSLN